MLLLINIEDKKADRFMELIKNNSDAKVKSISAPDAELFAEINEIKKAFKNAEKIKTGKLKGRSADELLNEL
ncbi:hypothetical protein [Mucilaginibacter sp.]|uniref:hypothetical protein n=1 Tax=Mucilaginibacter sp. TaxID=1882438 RepID=UPI0026270B14|nr:hypothetical protein [Mucilaginibacter sp.]MDB5031120.1 hypothetical protein [Mucilaginibacter sp.]